MPAPFAAIEARISSAVEAHLANAEADFGGAVGVVSGIFRIPSAEAFAMVGGTRPQFECRSAAVSSVARDAAVTINSISYAVTDIRPDGAGMTILDLDTV